jgi:hypothetical protein
VKCPIVLINRENSIEKNKNILFLDGDIDERIKQIVKDC